MVRVAWFDGNAIVLSQTQLLSIHILIKQKESNWKRSEFSHYYINTFVTLLWCFNCFSERPTRILVVSKRLYFTWGLLELVGV